MGPLVVRYRISAMAMQLAGRTEMNARFADRLRGLVAARREPFAVSLLSEGVSLEHSEVRGLTLTVLCESAGPDPAYLMFACAPDLLRAEMGLAANAATLTDAAADLIPQWPEVTGFEIQASPGPAQADDLYLAAVEAVRRDQRVSTAFLQRRLQIGYNRALGLVELLEQRGIVSPPDPHGRRKVLAPPP